MRSEILPPALNSPFKTFTGSKEDMDSAGYIPDKAPIINGEIQTAINIFQFSKTPIESSRFVSLFMAGKSPHVRKNEMVIAMNDTSTDSLKN